MTGGLANGEDLVVDRRTTLDRRWIESKGDEALMRCPEVVDHEVESGVDDMRDPNRRALFGLTHLLAA